MSNYPDPRGFVHLARRFEFHDIWQDGGLAVQLWVWILMRAAGKGGYKLRSGEVLGRGQFHTSYPQIAEALKFRYGRGFKRPSISTLTKYITNWISCGNLVVNRVGSGILITVCNYDKWNPKDFESCGESLAYREPYDMQYESSIVQTHKEGYKESINPVPPEREIPVLGHMSEPERQALLSLSEDTFVNRWLKTYQQHRPSAGHPLRNLDLPEMADVRMRIEDLEREFGEDQALKLLKKVFEDKRRPTSPAQAVLFSQKMAEAQRPRKESSNGRSSLRSHRIVKWNPEESPIRHVTE
jgi:hypothetical protein